MRIGEMTMRNGQMSSRVWLVFAECQGDAIPGHRRQRGIYADEQTNVVSGLRRFLRLRWNDGEGGVMLSPPRCSPINPV